jgi:enoyl-CoA hydratase
MEEDVILFANEGGIGIITINRPKAMNAMNLDLLGQLDNLLDKIKADLSVKVVILTGAGEKAFIAGADIAYMSKQSPLGIREFAATGQRISRKLETLPQPVIAAVNGFALGGGTELAISCDYILASENAKFGQPEVKIGVFPGFGGSQRLIRIVGKLRAKEMCFFGENMTARRGLEIGLVNEVVEPAKLMERAKELARKLIDGTGLLAVGLCKRAMEFGASLPLDEGLALEQSLFCMCFDSQDQKEGMAAFLEKRKPTFRGK